MPELAERRMVAPLPSIVSGAMISGRALPLAMSWAAAKP